MRNTSIRPERGQGEMEMEIGAVASSSSCSRSREEPRAEEEKLEDEDMMEEDQEEARKMKAHSTPRAPTYEEWKAHRILHLPYRSWCAHCVRGKKNNPAHKRIKDDGLRRGVPVVSFDYMYMTSRGQDASSPILVVKDHYQGGVWAMVALRKGAHTTHMAARIAEIIREAGYKKCVLKCDQEPAIRELQRA